MKDGTSRRERLTQTKQKDILWISIQIYEELYKSLKKTRTKQKTGQPIKRNITHKQRKIIMANRRKYVQHS